jgi:hypothetical protein
MATRVWIGAVRPVAQVTRWLFNGTWENNDNVIVTIGSKSITVVSGSATPATIVDNVVAELNNSNDPEFEEITWSRSGDYLVGTADEEGVPFTCTLTTTETGGGAADLQRFDGATSSVGVDLTACTGPNFANVAGNWSGATLPIDGDTVIFADSDVSCLYGLDNNAVTPASVYFDASFTGSIGLPVYNENGYYEYRERFLKYSNSGDATNMQVVVGQGEGGGSPRIKLNAGTGQSTVTVLSTGQPETDSEKAFEFIGTHASNEVNVSAGSVGIALHAGSAATVPTLRVGYQTNVESDSSVLCGLGATLTTVTQAGGTLETRSNITTLTLSGGEHVKAAGTVTTLNANGGVYIHNSTGTVTTIVAASGAEVDFSRDLRTKTVTNFTVNAGATLKDPHGVVTYTNGIVFNRCRPSDVEWEAAINKTWTQA